MITAIERRKQIRQSTPHQIAGRLTREGVEAAVTVVEKSSSGYTVSIAPDQAACFPGGEVATLQLGDGRFDCTVSGYFREGTLKSHLGLKLVVPAISESIPATQVSSDSNLQYSLTPLESDPPYRWYGAIAIAVFCLPGVGDFIGTAPLVRQAFQLAYQWSIQTIEVL